MGKSDGVQALIVWLAHAHDVSHPSVQEDGELSRIWVRSSQTHVLLLRGRCKSVTFLACCAVPRKCCANDSNVCSLPRDEEGTTWPCYIQLCLNIVSQDLRKGNCPQDAAISRPSYPVCPFRHVFHSRPEGNWGWLGGLFRPCHHTLPWRPSCSSPCSLCLSTQVQKF